MTASVTEVIKREPIVIADVQPSLGDGRYAPKRELGDWLLVSADVIRDGHDVLRAVVRYRAPGEPWAEAPLERDVADDRWYGSLPLDRIGDWSFTVEAWTDRFASWLDVVHRRGAPEAADLTEGRQLVAAALERAKESDAALLRAALERLDGARGDAARVAVLLDPQLLPLMERNADRSRAAVYDRVLPLRVDRELARFAAWYEIFPRSLSPRPGAHGTFDDAAKRIPAIAELGFDVVYLPPIHPIGTTFRKGRNNALEAAPGDVGSPYAIGSEDGGHTAVHPELGTLKTFRRFVETARKHGMEIALDYALQCSPDHPWIREHPEWFSFRPDGSIRYAENPPKKYQDIVNFNFESPAAPQLWEALRDVLFFWVEQGVRIFRVDNPHTKPIPFWRWVIAQVQERHPETIFLAEAFTRPKMMRELAKVGFSQSYTYFTWRNEKDEITAYCNELAHETNEYLRPNFFANTPDILHRYLQRGGRPAFRVRLVLAATLSSLYGIYSGFEFCENEAHPDSEEYLDSEKYQIRQRDWAAPESIVEDVRFVNRLRREHSALREFENVRFYPSNDDRVLFYGKTDYFQRDFVFVAVNLDPFAGHDAALEFPTGEFNLDAAALYDITGGAGLRWDNGRARLHLDPGHNPYAVFTVTR